MYCDCVDTLIRVLGAISGRAVEAGILHQAIGAVRQDFPFDVNFEIPGLGKIQPKSILGHGAVCQFTASDNVKRVDHAVAIAHRKAEENAIMPDSVQQLIIRDLIVQGHLIVAFLKQLHFGIGAHSGVGLKIIGVDGWLRAHIVIVGITDNQRTAAEVGGGRLKILVGALRIGGDAQSIFSVQGVDILIQAEPQRDLIPDVFQKHRVT